MGCGSSNATLSGPSEGSKEQAAEVETLLASANQGDHAAQVKLAIMYRNGNQVEQSYLTALRLLKSAVDAGYLPAFVQLGDMNEKGLGMGRKNNEEAIRLYSLAANAGNSEASARLGLMHRDGRGVPVDYLRAQSLLQAAADQGYVKAYRYIGEIYEFGPSGDYSTAIDFYERGIRAGDTDASVNLAMMHHAGHGYTQDQVRAEEILVPVALKLNMRAIFALRKMNGWDYKKNRKLARTNPELNRSIEIAAMNGDPYAQLLASSTFDYTRMGWAANFRMTALAADQGLMEAQLSLGNRYRDGQGTKRDVSKALEYYEKARAQGSPHATALIAKIKGGSYSGGAGDVAWFVAKEAGKTVVEQLIKSFIPIPW